MKYSVPLEQILPSRLEVRCCSGGEKLLIIGFDEFLEPFKVIGTDHERRLVYIQYCKVGPARPFNIVQVNPYKSPDTLSYSFVSSIGERLRDYRSPIELGAHLKGGTS